MPTKYPMIGDLDKPFHRPECECQHCEDWRVGAYNKIPTHLRFGFETREELQDWVRQNPPDPRFYDLPPTITMYDFVSLELDVDDRH